MRGGSGLWPFFIGSIVHGGLAGCKPVAFTQSWFDSSPADHSYILAQGVEVGSEPAKVGVRVLPRVPFVLVQGVARLALTQQMRMQVPRTLPFLQA